jgi:MFS family permease
MAVGTLTIAATPGYAAVGVLAPLLVLGGRLLQGFSAGVEIGGVSVYLAEIATPDRKGFFVCWQSASQQVAVGLAAIIGLVLGLRLTPDQMNAWGWRIPLLIGCLILPLVFILRRSLRETQEFLARPRPSAREILRSLSANSSLIFRGMMLATLTTVCFYLITAYAPTFGGIALRLKTSDVQIVILCVAISNFVWLPISGALSDRIGRRPILLGCALLTLATAYPALLWLTAAPSFWRLLAVELWLSFLFGSYNGAMVVYLTEMMPAEVRTAGFSVAYSLATGLFGGFTPAVCTWLIEMTGNKAVPGLWLSFAAVLALAALLPARSAALSPSPAEAR